MADDELTAWEETDRILTAKVPTIKGKLPTLSDFDDSYKGVIEETKNFYKNSDLTGPFKEFVKGKKK